MAVTQGLYKQYIPFRGTNLRLDQSSNGSEAASGFLGAPDTITRPRAP